jgi:hypothetical protein
MYHFGKKLAAVGFLVFLGLWIAGVVRSFALSQPDLPTFSAPLVSSSHGDEDRSARQTTSNLSQIGLKLTPLPKVLDQEDINQIEVHEKTAQLALGATDFGDVEAQIRQAIARHKAVIFSEKGSGIAPERKLVLGIGVHPDGFDALLHALSQTGQLGSIDVQKQDRTKEFRRLHANRQSLKKYQEAILKLRGTGKLSVEESLKLEQKIREIESEIQSTGVQLGDLLGKEPSYNLFVTLQEYQPGSRHDRGFTLVRRLGSGFLWAFAWWSAAAVGVGLLIAAHFSVQTLRQAPPAPRRVASTPSV